MNEHHCRQRGSGVRSSIGGGTVERWIGLSEDDDKTAGAAGAHFERLCRLRTSIVFGEVDPP